MIVNQCDLSVTADVPVMGAEVSEDVASVQTVLLFVANPRIDSGYSQHQHTLVYTVH